MPYILNKTNGTILTTVQDAALDSSTDLIFVGKNFAGYGEVQNENFLRLLENFANTSEPSKPISGQVWFDSLNKKLNVYNGAEWLGVSNLEVNSSLPNKTFNTGDLWFDTTNQQLKVYNGSTFSVIGPASGLDVQAGWRGSYELNYSESEGLLQKYAIKAIFASNNDDIVAVVSPETYTLDPAYTTDSFPLYPNLTKVYRGITLVGADPITGQSTSTQNYFWGTAAHSLYSNTATFALSSQAQGFTINTNTNGSYPMLFGSTSTTAVDVNLDYTNFYYNPNQKRLYVQNLQGLATSALYADIAERYHSDAPYEPGTVVVIGGDNEITITNIRANISVAGVISENPAYMMNSEAGSDATHPYVALKGRVKCKVVGAVKKGQHLVSSNKSGFAEVAKSTDSPLAIIGIALEDMDSDQGVVEIKV